MSTFNTRGNPDAFIFDLDGTLAEHVARGPFDEHKVMTDAVIEPVARVLHSLKRDYEIIFVSGRTDGCKEDTIKWIATKLGIHDPTIFMRKTGDHRKDSIIKKEIYESSIFPFYSVIGVFDDRLQVCRMLYENEIFCFNVNQGLREF